MINDELSNVLDTIANQNESPDLQTNVLDVLDTELQKYAQQYCEHSGKPCGKIKESIILDLVTIHGRNIAIELLKMNQKVVSMEWQWLNSGGLANLVMHKPEEYFVYAGSKLLQDLTMHSELMRLNEAADAWRKLQKIDKDILAPVNELIRRLLGRVKKKQLNKKLKRLSEKKINKIANTMEGIAVFQTELQNILRELIDADKKLKAYEDGMQVFRLQRMIHAISETELSINMELNDFELIDGKSIETTEMLTGSRYNKTKQNGKTRYDTPVIEAAGKVVLKFGGGGS